jgi:uncharacterized membrane protein YtjA (UPF0391 family)
MLTNLGYGRGPSSALLKELRHLDCV